jgi:hypothetical protein
LDDIAGPLALSVREVRRLWDRAQGEPFRWRPRSTGNVLAPSVYLGLESEITLTLNRHLNLDLFRLDLSLDYDLKPVRLLHRPA